MSRATKKKKRNLLAFRFCRVVSAPLSRSDNMRQGRTHQLLSALHTRAPESSSHSATDGSTTTATAPGSHLLSLGSQREGKLAGNGALSNAALPGQHQDDVLHAR